MRLLAHLAEELPGITGTSWHVETHPVGNSFTGSIIPDNGRKDRIKNKVIICDRNIENILVRLSEVSFDAPFREIARSGHLQVLVIAGQNEVQELIDFVHDYDGFFL